MTNIAHSALQTRPFKKKGLDQRPKFLDFGLRALGFGEGAFFGQLAPTLPQLTPPTHWAWGWDWLEKKNGAITHDFCPKKWGWKERSIIVCIDLFLELMGGRAGFLFFFYFWHFFSTCEKITQFLEFCKDQGGKI